MRQLTIAFLIIASAQGIDAQTPGANQAGGGQSNNSSPEPQPVKSWEARSIVGYHQAGAASADFDQNFFMDFFISRALHSKELWEGRLSLWGDVRIASAPQQVSTAVATFATDFASQIGKLPVNQLALSADFQSGFEARIKTWDRPGGAKRTLGLVAFFGALGLFESPSKNATIYEVPTAGSFQRDRFVAQFGDKVASYKYVGFLPPDRDRFYRQYGAGFRVTTYSKDDSPPGIYTFSVGQDEVITGGIFRSVVGRFDVFYPLPVNGKVFKSIYLFGTSSLRLGKAANIDAFVLNSPNIDPATGKPWADTSGNTLPPKVQPYDPSVALVTVRSTRDTYRIGVGVDLISLMQSIAKPKAPGPQSAGGNELDKHGSRKLVRGALGMK